MPGSTNVLLSARDIAKRYSGALVLDAVGFDVHQGEIHVLAGQNGAGKSTLIKILSGVVRPDAGEIFFRGVPVTLRSPRDAQVLGIVTIHQDIALALDLTVAENLCIGREPRRYRLPLVDRRAMRRQAFGLLDAIGVALDLDAPVRNLSTAHRQLLSIAKALAIRASVLILDEPTATLSATEIDLIFGVLRRLRQEGVGIIYVSHRLDEVKAIGDRVTVLRDGHWVATESLASLGLPALVGMIVGRDVRDAFHSPAAPGDEKVLIVEGLTAKGSFDDVSFSLKAGEILGLTGVVGSGKEAVGHAIFGDLQIETGVISVGGGAASAQRPASAIALGVGLVPLDRKAEGLFADRSVVENVTVVTLRRYARRGVLLPGARRRATSAHVQALDIRGPGLEALVKNLSGGNQQKVVLARWLDAGVRVLVLIEPTHGLDVGARVDVYRILYDLAASRVAILLISSELSEIAGLAHRVMVMRKGRIVAEMPRESASEHKLLSLSIAPDDANTGDGSWGAV
jgi:ribose transport system ATP-binding protein